MVYDVIIIGGGPAGLSAALILARCLRKVVVFDTGMPRNQSTGRINGLLTRDGIPPSIFTDQARKDIGAYDVPVIQHEIVKISEENFFFIAEDKQGKRYTGKKILIATGIRDLIPQVRGFDDYYGKGVFHCPYCDAYEYRGMPMAAYGKKKNAAGLALSLRNWSDDVSLLTDGREYISPGVKERLLSEGIKIYTNRISRLEGREGPQSVVFANEERIPCRVLFFSNGFVQQSPLARLLNCRFTKKGTVLTTKLQETNIPGVYVAGDAARDVQMVGVAMAEGIKAAVAINTALQEEVRKR